METIGLERDVRLENCNCDPPPYNKVRLVWHPPSTKRLGTRRMTRRSVPSPNNRPYTVVPSSSSSSSGATLAVPYFSLLNLTLRRYSLISVVDRLFLFACLLLFMNLSTDLNDDTHRLCGGVAEGE